MTENIENLLLEHLRGLRNDVASLRKEMREEFKDLKQRLITVERGIGGIKRESVELYDDHARQQAAIDRLAERIEYIEHRLEINA